MKIVVIFGSHRKNGQTIKVTRYFEQQLKKLVDVEFEYVIIKDTDLKLCGGCAQCLLKGEEFCPYKDDRDKILEKMNQADGIIFACSNYALNIPNIMKNFFDRTAYIFHRPQFFHKAFTSIVTQGVYGGDEIINYFSRVASFWGGIDVKGASMTIASGAYDPNTPWSDDEQKEVDQKTKKLARRYAKALMGNRSPKPKMFNLIVFRGARSYHKYANEDNKDHKYFQEKGWFESGYYYPVKLGIVKKCIGFFIDKMQKSQLKK